MLPTGWNSPSFSRFVISTAGKKVLHTSALAGLAAKLDFTTVKLRKTGIVEQMMVDPDDPASGERMMHRKAAHNDATNTYGVEITTHNMMLLKIKGQWYTCYKFCACSILYLLTNLYLCLGRKQVQTRLVEPVSESLNNQRTPAVLVVGQVCMSLKN